MEQIAYRLAEYIKFKTKNDIDIIYSNELLNYIIYEDCNSETDKYFKTHDTKYNYDELFFNMFIDMPQIINFDSYCSLRDNKEKIIEYALLILSKKIV